MLKAIIYFFLTLVFLFGYLRFIERRAVYFPLRQLETFPDRAGLAYEDIDFVTDDGKKLNGWFLANQKGKFTILFCHGNAGNISHRMEKLLILNQVGLEIFIFDYRGYGRSQGRPSEGGLYRDAEAAYQYLVSGRRIEPEKIILYGESLGGSVAVDLAGKKTIKALIIEEGFTSAKDMARMVYPYLPSFLISAKFDSVSKIKGINAPKLVIHSIDDEIVPCGLAEKLFDSAAEPKTFLKIKGGHNTAFLDSEGLYRRGIADFLNGL